MKNCIERVKLSSGFAVMVFVFAGSVFTARYLRLNKGTCRPSYLPCPLFIQVRVGKSSFIIFSFIFFYNKRKFFFRPVFFFYFLLLFFIFYKYIT